MALHPAPEGFLDLRDFLHEHEVDAERLVFVLQQYLDQPQHHPRHDWYLDPLTEHQAWSYLENVKLFMGLIVPKDDADAFADA